MSIKLARLESHPSENGKIDIDRRPLTRIKKLIENGSTELITVG
jgi:hypothetical protein